MAAESADIGGLAAPWRIVGNGRAITEPKAPGVADTVILKTIYGPGSIVKSATKVSRQMYRS